MSEAQLVVIEFLSLWASLTGIALAVMTVRHWWHAARRFVLSASQRTSTGWLTLGVFISFAAAVVDSGYWHAAWSADYMNWSARDWLFRHGVVMNLPFRNITLILAAYCHYRAFAMAHPSHTAKRVNRVTLLWVVIGFVVASTMAMLR